MRLIARTVRDDGSHLPNTGFDYNSVTEKNIFCNLKKTANFVSTKFLA